MLKPPKVPWLYRVAALVVAIAIGLYTLQFYVFGAKFAGAVANYAKMAAEQDAAAQAQHKPAGPDFKNEPGVVPVSIVPTKAEKKQN
jgi:hypothetical protein